MKIFFPYGDVPPLTIPDGCDPWVFSLPDCRCPRAGLEGVRAALENPIQSARLRDIARGKERVLIVVDDHTRPTPVRVCLPLILRELDRAGIEAGRIEFLTALGTHRPMTAPEIAGKLGPEVAGRYRVHTHDWKNPETLEYLGETAQGVPIRVNRKLRESAVVVGVGSIMPIDVCGFSGGGKLLVPGLSGEDTVDQMHWARVNLPAGQVIGRADNPIRDSIDFMARKAGLAFIVNVVLDAGGNIAGAFAGDMVAAHRTGCATAARVYGVRFTREFDIVVADSHPFDIDFWQANKALDTAGEFVARGGVIILVSPCREGLSRTHAGLIREFGYQPIEAIRRLVDTGRLRQKVVGVHMAQVSRAAVEKAGLILVSSGIGRCEAQRLGFRWAPDPDTAFRMALELVGRAPEVAVLKDAARMLPLRE